jgi:hypothetical protein
VDARAVGLGIIVFGVIAIVVGLAAYFGLLSWFGRLPGDVRIDKGSVKVYAPLTSMLIVSVVVSLLFALLRRS